MLDNVYIKGNQMNFFQQNVEYFIAPYITKEQITVSTKNGGGDHKRRLSRVHYICTMHCVQCTLEKQCTTYHIIKGDFPEAKVYYNVLHVYLKQ